MGRGYGGSRVGPLPRAKQPRARGLRRGPAVPLRPQTPPAASQHTPCHGRETLVPPLPIFQTLSDEKLTASRLVRAINFREVITMSASRFEDFREKAARHELEVAAGKARRVAQAAGEPEGASQAHAQAQREEQAQAHQAQARLELGGAAELEPEDVPALARGGRAVGRVRRSAGPALGSAVQRRLPPGTVARVVLEGGGKVQVPGSGAAAEAVGV
jgi:hypothetical protein